MTSTVERCASPLRTFSGCTKRSHAIDSGKPLARCDCRGPRSLSPRSCPKSDMCQSRLSSAAFRWHRSKLGASTGENLRPAGKSGFSSVRVAESQQVSANQSERFRFSGALAGLCLYLGDPAAGARANTPAPLHPSAPRAFPIVMVKLPPVAPIADRPRFPASDGSARAGGDGSGLRMDPKEKAARRRPFQFRQAWQLIPPPGAAR